VVRVGESPKVGQAVDIGEGALNGPPIPFFPHRREEALLAAEVLKQCGVRDVGSFGDRAQGAAGVAVLSEDVYGDIDHRR